VHRYIVQGIDLEEICGTHPNHTRVDTETYSLESALTINMDTFTNIHLRGQSPRDNSRQLPSNKCQ
jgi:hypothetical protein